MSMSRDEIREASTQMLAARLDWMTKAIGSLVDEADMIRDELVSRQPVDQFLGVRVTPRKFRGRTWWLR